MRIIKKLRCFLFGHDYRTHQALTPWSRRVVCDCCAGDWAMNDSVRTLVEWSTEFEEFYRSIGIEIKPVVRGATCNR